MSYPQPQYPPPPQQWGPPVPSPPSKGTTIGAAVLALLAGLATALAIVVALITLGRYASGALTQPAVMISFGLNAVSCLLLLIGAIMLFARAGAGRFMVIAGAVIKLALLAWAVVSVGALGLMNPLGLLILLLSLVAAMLAIVPSTGRWIATKQPQPQHGFSPGYPPPGYPQPGQQPGYGPPKQW